MTRHLFVALAFVLTIASSCNTAVSKEPWYEGDVRRGTLVKTEVPRGYDYEYVDNNDRVVRREKRDTLEELAAGACIQTLEYDDAGRAQRIANYDASLGLACVDDCYAIEEIRYEVDGQANVTEEHVFLDAGGHPTLNADGYAKKIVAFDGGRMDEIRLLDVAGRPASGTYFDVPGTSMIEFAYLQGIGEVVYAVFRGPAGEIVDKRQLSGEVFQSFSQYNNYNYTYYNYDYNYAPYR